MYMLFCIYDYVFIIYAFILNTFLCVSEIMIWCLVHLADLQSNEKIQYWIKYEKQVPNISCNKHFCEYYDN
jgi:hypothetical protein